MTDLAAAPDSAISLSRGRRWAALAVLSASLLVITMDMTILNIALPEMAADLHPSATQQLWIVDVYSLVLAGLLVSVAALADRWGRRRMLLLGYAVFAAASLAVLVADSAAEVIVIRALLGVGGAMIMPTTLSLIRVIFPDPAERATALSIWAAVSGLGAVIGPLVGGFLLEHFAWQSAFLVNVPLMLVGIVAGLLLLPESRVADPGRWDAFSAALSLIGMVALVWGIKEFGKAASFAVPQAWLALVVALVSLGWFARRCLHSSSPLLELRLFRSRQFSAGVIAALGAMFSMLAALLLIAQWMQLVEGASPIEAGVRLIPMAVAGALAAIAAPPLSRLIGSRAVLAAGLALAGIGLLYIGLANQVNLPAIIVALVLVGAGMGALAIASTMIMGGVAPEKAGNAGAVEETSYELGGTLGIAILGSISAIVYRAGFTTSPEFARLEQFDPVLADQSKESLGAAVAIGEALDTPELGAAAGADFTDSLQMAGVVGGAIILVVAAIVFLVTPKGTDVSTISH